MIDTHLALQEAEVMVEAVRKGLEQLESEVRRLKELAADLERKRSCDYCETTCRGHGNETTFLHRRRMGYSRRLS